MGFIMQLLPSFNDIHGDIRSYNTKISHTELGFVNDMM